MPDTSSEKINSTDPADAGMNWYLKMTVGLLMTRSEDSAPAGLQMFVDGLAAMANKS